MPQLFNYSGLHYPVKAYSQYKFDAFKLHYSGLHTNEWFIDSFPLSALNLSCSKLFGFVLLPLVLSC